MEDARGSTLDEFRVQGSKVKLSVLGNGSGIEPSLFRKSFNVAILRVEAVLRTCFVWRV